MTMPRDLSGRELAAMLSLFGYRIVRQTGSHIRLTTDQNGQHHVTIPDHDSLKVGTLSGISNSIANHFGITKQELLLKLFP